MDKLIEIAKECGAYPFDPTGTFTSVDTLVFRPEKLHAYTEQVCRPLVEALQASIKFHNAEGIARQALADHRANMGDKK